MIQISKSNDQITFCSRVPQKCLWRYIFIMNAPKLYIIYQINSSRLLQKNKSQKPHSVAGEFFIIETRYSEIMKWQQDNATSFGLAEKLI